MTGPCFLTGVYLGFDNKDKISIHDCHLFTPTDDRQRDVPQYGDEMHPPVTRHYWQGSWFRPDRPGKRITRSLTTAYHRLHYHLIKGAAFDPAEAQRRIDSNVLNQDPPMGDKLAILVPVRDGASHLEPFVEAISATDLMSENTKLVFCEGDSIDGTRENLNVLAHDLRHKFRDIVVLHKDVGTRFEHGARGSRMCAII